MTAGRVAVAVSGGRDSMALLHALASAARGRGVEVWALHVHHGLMPEADAWAAFVERRCKLWSRRGLPLRFAMRRLAGGPGRGESVEAWARAGRYAALAAMAREAGCGAVALAHHRGDQAETFLLQALRGAGVAGLAAMPAHAERGGIAWLRPWLEQPRSAIEAYARRHRIAFVDDASNADPRFARSRLRQQVMPALTAAFAQAEQALAEAARQAAQARALIDEIAHADVAAVSDGEALVLERWRALSPSRRRECLRAWLARRCAGGVAQSLLDRLLEELAGSAPARWPCGGGVELRRYRGRLTLAVAPAQARLASARDGAGDGAADPGADGPVAATGATIDRLGTHAVPGTQCSLRVSRARDGLPQALLHGAQWRARSGGVRFQRAPGTPPRSLKKQYQAAGIPAWSRDAPLLFAADGRLLFVPGLGIDARALAAEGAPRVRLAWLPGR